MHHRLLRGAQPRTPASWCTPAPVIRRPSWSQADGTTRLLDGARATPLGLSFDRSRARSTATSSRRGPPCCSTPTVWWSVVAKPLDAGIARAADLVQDNRATALDDLASEIMSRLAPGGGYQDDVALLLYRQPAPLEVELPAEASQLASHPRRAAGLADQAGWMPTRP